MQLPAAGFVDVHVHIQPWEQLKPDVRAKMTQGRPDLEQISTFQGDPHAFAAYLDEMGVALCGLVNYPAPRIMGFDQSTNDFVAAYRDQRPDKFLAWGGMDPEWVADPRGEMERLLDELRLDGIKVHPPHQGFRANAYLHELPELRVLYETCEARGVPVMVHTGTSVFPGARSNLGNPMDCDDIAVDFPELKLVMAHCGRPLWYEEAFFVCRRHPNAMMDISGIPPQQLASVLPRLELLGDKILWGTDWPSPGVKNLRANAEAFAALEGFSDAFKMKVLVDNPNRVWPVAAS